MAPISTVGADRPSAEQQGKKVTGRPKRVGQHGDWVGIFRSNDAEAAVTQEIILLQSLFLRLKSHLSIGWI
jgi:hypothetical protein